MDKQEQKVNIWLTVNDDNNRLDGELDTRIDYSADLSVVAHSQGQVSQQVLVGFNHTGQLHLADMVY